MQMVKWSVGPIFWIYGFYSSYSDSARGSALYIGPKWHTKRCNSLDIDLRAKRGPGSEFPVLPWWFWYPTLLPYDKICTFYSSFSIPILRIPGLSRFFMFFEPKMTGMGLSRPFLGRFGSNFVVVDVNGDPWESDTVHMSLFGHFVILQRINSHRNRLNTP